MHKLGNKASPETDPASTFILDLQTLRRLENKFLCLKNLICGILLWQPE